MLLLIPFLADEWRVVLKGSNNEETYIHASYANVSTNIHMYAHMYVCHKDGTIHNFIIILEQSTCIIGAFQLFLLATYAC